MLSPNIEKRLIDFAKAIKRQPDFDFIQKVLKHDHQAEVFLVGGAVRDIILDQEVIKDFDFVIRGLELADLQELLCRLGIIDLVGKNFGVIKFKPFDGIFKIPFDIALPRSEHALMSGGYRDFNIQSNPQLAIEDDLSRRDFTINALAWDFKNQKLVDPYGGVNDLGHKIIRTVGEPLQRFKEDYSRMLRAIRLACQLDFQINETTWQVVKKNIKNINNEKDGELVVPRETVGSEFLKAFYHNPTRALDLFEESGFLKELVPELLAMQGCPQPKNWHSEGDVWAHTCLALKKLKSPEFIQQFGKEHPSANLTIALLLHDLGKPATIQTPEKDGSDRLRFNEHDLIGAQIAETVCQRLKLNSVPDFDFDQDQVFWLIKNHMIAVQGNIDKMKNSTIEKYFFSQRHPSQDLLKLTFADVCATIPEKGEVPLGNFRAILYRMEQIKKLGRDHAGPPAQLINGNQIMKLLDLAPGQLVGQVLSAVREEQLRGRIRNEREAKKFVKGLNLNQLP
ncbi:MAG: HD domain-containing protein [bacterium]